VGWTTRGLLSSSFVAVRGTATRGELHTPPIGGELYTSGAAPGVKYTPQTEGESNTLDDGLAREGR